MEDICMYCSSWYTSRTFMTKYGEGSGKCMRLGYEYALYREIHSNWDEVRTMRYKFYNADGSI